LYKFGRNSRIVGFIACCTGGGVHPSSRANTRIVRASFSGRIQGLASGIRSNTRIRCGSRGGAGWGSGAGSQLGTFRNEAQNLGGKAGIVGPEAIGACGPNGNRSGAETGIVTAGIRCLLKRHAGRSCSAGDHPLSRKEAGTGEPGKEGKPKS
jgi:hypothetical protein